LDQTGKEVRSLEGGGETVGSKIIADGEFVAWREELEGRVKAVPITGARHCQKNPRPQ